MEYQKTIGKEVSYTGTGLHTGCRTTITFKPADADSGLVFIRKCNGVDYPIKVDVSSVVDAPRRTTLGRDEGCVHTVEHVLAAVAGMGIDNLSIEVDEAEVPDIEGNSLAYAKMLEQAGIVKQEKPKRLLRIKTAVFVRDGDIYLTAIPSDTLRVSFTIDYGKRALDAQYAEFEITKQTFIKEIAPARTFCFEEEAKHLQAQGLGKGANLSNTVVIGENGIVNGELKFKNEFVRHKILDLLGDLCLLGGPFIGHIIAIKSGHSSNIKLIRLLKDAVVPAELEEERKGKGEEEKKVVFDIEAIKRILPHRYPFLLVDRIIELEEDKRIVGIKNVTANEIFFEGHFPQRPIMPGVLIIEAIAQTAGVLLLRKEENLGKLAYVMSINNVRLRRPVVPGDQLYLEVEVCKLRKKTGKIKGRALVEGQLAVEAEIVFAVVEV